MTDKLKMLKCIKYFMPKKRKQAKFSDIFLAALEYRYSADNASRLKLIENEKVNND